MFSFWLLLILVGGRGWGLSNPQQTPSGYRYGIMITKFEIVAFFILSRWTSKTVIIMSHQRRWVRLLGQQDNQAMMIMILYKQRPQIFSFVCLVGFQLMK